MPGGFLSISAHWMENGVLWAAVPMHDDAWIDINFAKYAPPTVANGKVYLATFSGFVNVYGLRTADSSRDASANQPDCKVSDFMMEPNYKKTKKAAQGHVH